MIVYRFSTIAQQYNITSKHHIQQHITQTQHHTIQHNDMQLDLSSIYTLQTMISYLVYNTIDISSTAETIDILVGWRFGLVCNSYIFILGPILSYLIKMKQVIIYYHKYRTTNNTTTSSLITLLMPMLYYNRAPAPYSL